MPKKFTKLNFSWSAFTKLTDWFYWVDSNRSSFAEVLRFIGEFEKFFTDNSMVYILSANIASAMLVSKVYNFEISLSTLNCGRSKI